MGKNVKGSLMFWEILNLFQMAGGTKIQNVFGTKSAESKCPGVLLSHVKGPMESCRMGLTGFLNKKQKSPNQHNFYLEEIYECDFG